jgi:hypothetical protein
MNHTPESADKHVLVGSRWSDNYDPENFPRIVEVVRVTENNRVIIKTVRMSGNPGYARHTETDLSRFGRPGRTGFTLQESATESNGQCAQNARRKTEPSQGEATGIRSAGPADTAISGSVQGAPSHPKEAR